MQTSKFTLNDEAEHGPEGYLAIDGNWLKKPVGYCAYHHGYLTEKLVRIHRCHKKHGGTCSKYHTMEGVNIKRMRQDQFYDKALDRMQKLEASINRAVRSLDRIADAIEMEAEIAKTIRVEAMGEIEESEFDRALRNAVPMPSAEEIFGGVEAVDQDAKEWENIHK